MVPNGWEVKKFGDLFNVKSGFGFKHSEYVDSGTPLIKIDNVSHGYVKWNNVSYLPDIYREEYSDILLKEGDLLLALNRPITQGKLKLVKLTKNDVPSILYQRVGRIDFKTNDLEKDFYLYLLDTAIYRFVSHKAIGSDQPFISTTELKKLNIVKPPLPEQRKIAKILSTWDKAISTTERLIDNSKQQKKALMQQLLTGAHTQRKRLLDESGKPFEGEWEEVKFGDCINHFGGTALEKHVCEDATHHFISIGNYSMDGKYVDKGQRVSLNEKTSAKLLQKGELVMVLNDKTKTGDIIGSTILIDEDNKYIYNQRSERIIPKRDVHIIFFWFLLNSSKFRAEVFNRSQGGTQIYINFSSVKTIQIKLPSILEQQKIASVLINADQEIVLLEQQLADLKQEKKALMQQLLTGKRRVKVDDKEVV